MDDTRSLDRPDRIGMYMSIVLVAIGAGLTIFSAVNRLRDVASGGAIPVLVPLAGENAQLPLGPDGTAVQAQVESAIVHVSEPASATLFALWAQPIWGVVCICAGLVLAAMFFLRLARGKAFNGGAARLAFIGAGVLVVGWFGNGILTNMATNGALSRLSDYSYDSVVFEVSLMPIVGVLLLAATGAALQIGERLQRDTEGLV